MGALSLAARIGQIAANPMGGSIKKNKYTKREILDVEAVFGTA